MPKDIVLETRTLTGTTNLIKPRANLWQQLLWPTSVWETLPTSTVELSYITGERESAPFVKNGASAILVGGDSESFAVVETPNIRIKRNLDPKYLAQTRHPGMSSFVQSGAEVLSGAQRYVALQAQRLRERVDNTIEVMCAQLIQGKIAYHVDGGDSFEITLPRDAALDIDLITGKEWDNAVQTDVHIAEDFMLAKDLVAERLGLPVRKVVLGSKATTYFLRNAEVLKFLENTRNLDVGRLSLENQFERSGAIRLGTFADLEVWSYARSVSYNGTTFKLVRDEYAEFISDDPSAENVMYFGAIMDLDAMGLGEGGDGGGFQAPFFSKSWTERDPSIMQMLIHSRPLPWTRKANSRVSMKVTS